MELRWDDRLDAMGARLESSPDAEFHLVEARWQDEQASRDKHHIYVRVLDEKGTPVEGHPFRVGNGGVFVDHTKGAGFDDYWGNFPMYAGGAYSVDIPDGVSDKVSNLPSGTPANRYANTCFFLVFQRGGRGEDSGGGGGGGSGGGGSGEGGGSSEGGGGGGSPSPKLDAADKARLLAFLTQAQTEIDAARTLLESLQ